MTASLFAAAVSETTLQAVGAVAALITVVLTSILGVTSSRRRDSQDAKTASEATRAVVGTTNGHGPLTEMVATVLRQNDRAEQKLDAVAEQVAANSEAVAANSKAIADLAADAAEDQRGE